MTDSSINRVAAVLARPLAYLLLHPRRRPPHRSPADHGLTTWESVSITTDDRRSIAGWLFPGIADRLAVVGHGIGQSRSASLAQATHLHERGYTVLLHDLRNHGRSSRDPSGANIAARYTADVELLAQWLRREHGTSDAVLVLFGFSFSTFPSLAATANGGAGIDALICDSGPGVRLQSLFEGFFRVGYGPRVPGFTTPSRRAALHRAIGSDAVRRLGSQWPPPAGNPAIARTPMLFIVGTDDEVMPPREVRSLTDDYPSAAVVELPGGHLRGYKEHRDHYLAAIDTFLSGVESAHDARPSGAER